MGPTDQPLGNMTLSELLRIIGREVSRQVPPIPAKIAELADHEAPLIPPTTANDGQALVYEAASGGYIVSDEVISAVTAATADIANDVADGIITTAKIVDNAVNAAKLGDNSVDTDAIVNSAVQTAKLNDLAVTTGKIALLAVDTAQIAGAAITTAKIGNAQITNALIGSLAVDTANIAASAITTAKINDAAITNAKIGSLAVDTANIAAAAISTAKIADAAITNAKINDLDAAKITAGTIDAARIAAGSITAGKLSVSTLDAITASMGTLTSGTITGGTIQTGAVSTARLVLDSASLRSVDASNATLWSINAATGAFALGSGVLVSNLTQISGALGTPSSGNATNITNLQAGNISAGDIAAARMQTNILAAASASITTLSSITANIGTITAGTITGATFQSASSNPKVVHDSTGLYANDANGTQTFLIDATTGTFKGSVYLNTSSGLVLAGGVSQPLTAPALTATVGGSLSASTQYFVSYAWYDGTRETPFYTTVPSVNTTVPNKTIQIVLPAAPTGATYARIYMNTSAFVQGGGFLQTLSNADTKVAVSTSTTTTISVSAFAGASASSPSPATLAFQGPFGTTATLRPANMTDSTGAAYGWTLEGNGRMRFVGPTSNVQFWVYDDFYYIAGAYPATTGGTVGSLAYQYSGTGATVTAGTSSNADPGVVQFTTGTTTTGVSRARTNLAFSLGVARIRFSIYFMIDTTAGATNSFQIVMGLTNNAAGTALVAGDLGIVFQLNNDTTGNVLRLAVADGATLVTQNSGLTLTGGSWHFAEFEVDAGRTAVNWWVDNVKQTAITSHIPASGGSLMAMLMGIIKTNTGSGTAARTLNVDAVSLYGDYVTG